MNLLAASLLTFATPLSRFQWAVLAGIPVGIILLYFLKLRRKPVQVSSTLLWRKSLEDLHVNSLFQRLRKNLLLFLQLLILALAMFALAGPRFKGTTTQGQRYVLAMDESASMRATDVSPSRLDRAKLEAKKIVDGMERGDLTMIVAFSDRARVVSNYTANRTLLKQRIDAIQPTENTTNLREALQVVSGLAIPTSDRDAREGSVATESMIPPKLTIFTDGGFPDVEGFSIGKIEPNVVVIGPPRPADGPDAKPGVPSKSAKNPSDNVAILALLLGPQRRQARAIPGVRSREEFPGRGGKDPGPPAPARPEEARRERLGRRRPGADHRSAFRAILPVRPHRERAGRAGGPA